MFHKVNGAIKLGVHQSWVLTTEDEISPCEYLVACEDAGPIISLLLHMVYILCLAGYYFISNQKWTVVGDFHPLYKDLIFILSKYNNLSSLPITSSGPIFSKQKYRDFKTYLFTVYNGDFCLPILFLICFMWHTFLFSCEGWLHQNSVCNA